MATHSVVGSARGFAAPGFERVVDAFERNFRQHGELGAAFAAYVKGEPVVDLWGGLRDRARSLAWEGDTLMPVFSGSKGLVATAIAMLIDRGQLSLDAPVCHYWPEFAAEGKAAITVRHVVSHRAGLPGLETPVSVEEAADAVRMAQLLAGQRPIARAGERFIYHALTFGWLCGELIRRIDGRSVGQFLREEIALPLGGLDLWVGLPSVDERRVAVIEVGTGVTTDDSSRVLGPNSDPVAWSIWSNPPRFRAGSLAANLRSWHAAEVPASSGIAAPRSLAALYEVLAHGGTGNGVHLLGPETIRDARVCQVRGHDPYLDLPMAFGTGFQVQTDAMELGPEVDAFGHAGAGGSLHGAWPTLGIGFSYAPNLLGSFVAADLRGAALLDALHACALEHGLRA